MFSRLRQRLNTAKNQAAHWVIHALCVQHLQRKVDELELLSQPLDEKLERLRAASAIETGVAVLFQLEKQIEEAEKERAELDQQIGAIEQQIVKLSDGIVSPTDFKQLFACMIQAVYRSWKASVTLMVVSGVLLLIFLPRPTWVSRAKFGDNTRAIYNTRDTLVAGAYNPQNPCHTSPKGIWYRSLTETIQWQESIIEDEALCDQATGYLDDILEFSAVPGDSSKIYALTRRNGLLKGERVKQGWNFTSIPASAPPFSFADPKAWTFVVVGTPAMPVFWVAGEDGELWRSVSTGDNEFTWQRMDGQKNGGCADLPVIQVKKLAYIQNRLLIGTSKKGLWVSEGKDQRCRRVFDGEGEQPGRYNFYEIRDVSLDSQERYLIVVYDTNVDQLYGSQPGWQLLMLYPASTAPWQVSPDPVWATRSPLFDLVVQKNDGNLYIWYVVTSRFSQVVQGDLASRKIHYFAPIFTCLFDCQPKLVEVEKGAVPHLILNGREYQRGTAGWWRQFWP